MSQAVARIY